MKTINFIFLIGFICLSTIVLFTPVESSRLRRQLFPSMATASSSSSNSGTGAGASVGGFSLPWFGQMPSPTSFQLPMNMFPNPDQVRQRAQDYISVVSKQIQDTAIQNMNKLQSLLPLPSRNQNCTQTETKTETVDVNGRKFNQTTTSCISSGPGSVATAVSSSSVPITETK